MQIVIRLLGPDDAALVCNAPPGVFDRAPQASLTTEFLNDSRHHLIAALDDERIVGIVSAVHYIHPDKPAELWINEVAVAPTHQIKGIGRDMLDAMLAHGRTLGCVSAWVLTESENNSAMRLYAGAGGVERALPSVMFEFALSQFKNT